MTERVECSAKGCKRTIVTGADLYVDGKPYCFQSYNELGDSHFHDAFSKKVNSITQLPPKVEDFLRELFGERNVKIIPNNKQILISVQANWDLSNLQKRYDTLRGKKGLVK